MNRNELVDTTVEGLLDEYPHYTEQEITAAVTKMVERGIEMTAPAVAHSLEAERLVNDLTLLGFVLSNDGRTNQVSPTSDGRGRALLTFKQLRQLINMAKANALA